jgi:protein phosphatase
MTFPARDEDVFLLCSDGLTTMVSDEEIREILVRSKTLRSAVNRLVDAANRGGGRDNITAVAFRVADADAKEGEEGATLIARTGEQAGLTGERVRAATDRLRGRGPMPAPSGRRRALRWTALLGVIALVVGGAVLFARSIYFLGTDDGGNVALYRGPPYQLPFGISLYSKQYSIPVQEGTLSEDRQRAVTGHTLRGKDDATSLVNDIQQQPTEGLPPPPPLPPPTQPKKKHGAASKGKQAQKR